MAVEQFANNASTTLNGAVDNVQASVPVHSVTTFPGSPQFRLLVESELMLVTSISGSVFTVTRGVEGTTSAAHADAATVTHVLTSGGLVGVGGSINLTGSYAGMPAAGVVGRTYYPNDSVIAGFDTGSAWQGFGPVYPLTPPPALSGWIWVNAGTSTSGQAGGMIRLQIPANTGDNIRGIVRPISATPYVVVAGLLPRWGGENFTRVGMGLYNSVSGSLLLHWWDMGNTGTTFSNSIVTQYWNSVTSFNNGVAGGTIPSSDRRALQCPLVMLRIRDDGSNRSFEVSMDGQYWELTATDAHNAFIQPTHIGVFLEGFNTSKTLAVSVISWSVA